MMSGILDTITGTEEGQADDDELAEDEKAALEF